MFQTVRRHSVEDDAETVGADNCDVVIALVSSEKRVPPRLLTHPYRCRNTASQARQLAMYLSHVALGRSLAEVGSAFQRHRTTVSHACAMIEELREDPQFDAEVSRLERAIEDLEALDHVA